MRLFVAGATGVVGQSVLAQALANDRIRTVIAPTRRPLEARPRLINPTWLDLDRPANEGLWRVDSAICALGTTRQAAGSAAAFRAVDHDLVLSVASHLRASGTRQFGFVSSIGADARSTMLYLRTKGEVEEALRALRFPALTLLRPGVLDGDRSENRPIERLMLTILRTLEAILPASMRVSPVRTVARLLLEAAISSERGERVISAATIARAETNSP